MLTFMFSQVTDFLIAFFLHVPYVNPTLKVILTRALCVLVTQKFLGKKLMLFTGLGQSVKKLCPRSSIHGPQPAALGKVLLYKDLPVGK